MPKKATKAQKGWDLDLAFGEFHEQQLAEILTGKIEVKTDRMAFRTGNLAVEYYCNGKPSGITSTEAENWAINVLDKSGDVACTFIVPTERLRKLVDDSSCRSVSGGDRNASRMLLVPMDKIFSLLQGT